MEYYYENAIYAVGKLFGKPMKVDINMATRLKGRYARVEMHLKNPLASTYKLKGNNYRFESEHIHSLYFSCGRIGHSREYCNWKQEILVDMTSVSSRSEVAVIPNVAGQ